MLRGQKTYISGVEHADAVLVVARSRLPDGQLGLPSLCLVDVDAPGFTREPIPMPYVGPDQQWTLFFDDVELEEDRLVGGEGGGLGPVFDGLNPERIMGATIACGAGRRALAKASAYANEREVWGAPIGTHQGVSHPLAEAKIELELARLMTQKAAALCDARAPGAGEASNMAKYSAAEAAIKCVDRTIQAHGGNGFALEYELTDMWWGVRLTRTAPVSREMILNYVAEHSLGLPEELLTREQGEELGQVRAGLRQVAPGEHQPVDHRAVDQVHGQLDVQGLGQLAALHRAGEDLPHSRAQRPDRHAFHDLVKLVVADGLGQQLGRHTRHGPARHVLHLALPECCEVSRQGAGVRGRQLRPDLVQRRRDESTLELQRR